MSEPSWWQRNWKWFVPAGCGTLVLLFAVMVGSIFWFATSMMRSSEAYAQAFAAATTHPAVVEALGTPIEPDGFTGGSIETTPSSGNADLKIPIAGPRGNATVYVVAVKQTGRWIMKELVVDLPGGDRVDLLADDQPRNER